jgi:hypothetical protein
MSSNPNASYATQLAKGHHAKRVYQSQPTSYSTTGGCAPYPGNSCVSICVDTSTGSSIPFANYTCQEIPQDIPS